MKKGILIVLVLSFGLVLMGCTLKPKLYVLNWGDYMDPAIIDAFETEYGVRVIYKQVGSNEEMATLLQSQTARYDIAIPSDYMIDKLTEEGLLQPIDFDLLVNFDPSNIIPELSQLYTNLTYAPYLVPYMWGTIGIMYNTEVVGLAELMETEDWGALFEHGDEYSVGMYDSPRDAIAAGLLYCGYNVNSETVTELAAAEAALTNAQFSAWGEDNLKSMVIDGTLDMSLVYSGDYFSEYYIAEADGVTINFDFYVPVTTNVWLDAMVIPEQSQNPALAHQFIDFLIQYDNAAQNADYIGYAPVFTDVFLLMQSEEYGYVFPSYNPYPVGALRQMYVYGSDERATSIEQILYRAKLGH